VADHCEALWAVLERGEPGETYNIGGNEEQRNIDLVHAVCDLLQDLRPPEQNPRVSVAHYRDLITFVDDRPGHDFRYAIDAVRVRSEIGWRPRENLASGLLKTIRWYLDNEPWVKRAVSGEYRDWIDENYGHRL
jgi:dTDP-glucose 4,6-dehydratase